jgi:hypothetical protein
LIWGLLKDADEVRPGPLCDVAGIASKVILGLIPLILDETLEPTASIGRDLVINTWHSLTEALELKASEVTCNAPLGK